MLSFQPLPLLSNPHVQTILGNLLTGGSEQPPNRPHAVVLPDSDRVLIHETAPRRLAAGEPMALLVHGLGGCARSAYLLRLTQRLLQRGWRVFRMNLRGAGEGAGLARRFYTAACSQDVRTVAEYLLQAFPSSPLAVVGISLGGNIVLKFAVELGAAVLPGLQAVAAISPPIDLVRCSDLLTKYPFYDSFYVKHLIRQVHKQQRFFPDLQKASFPRKLTVRGFDDIYTAPRWGYANALDYYRQASLHSQIAEIRLPTFILTARDDPFVAVEPFEAIPAPEQIEIHISAHGGHLGFLGVDQTGGIRWAETQLIHWLVRQLQPKARLSCE